MYHQKEVIKLNKNIKNNIREYYHYFVDYYIFDYEYDFSNSISKIDVLAKEKLEIEKQITDTKATINRIRIEKTSKNVEMVSNGERNDAIDKMNMKYQKSIDEYNQQIRELNKKLENVNKKMEKVQIF